MKKLIVFLAIFLYSANLIDVNFFEHKKFVDILFSLDAKFNGKIKKIDKEFLLTNVNTNKIIEKKIKDFKVKVLPAKDGIKLSFNHLQNKKISFSLTPDGYGIRVRIVSPTIENKNVIVTNNKELNRIDYFSYFFALAILIFLAIILLLIKKKKISLPAKRGDLNILFQRPLDTKNRLILIEFNDRKYLMVVGNSNILIDVFDKNMNKVESYQDIYLQKEELKSLHSKIDDFRKYIENAENLKELDERI